ncbi:acetyltransferase [Metarhizium anisopliae]|nr:acetyltransferase [Metarhizium anisopliae]
MAFIRRYRASDFEATAHICRETLPADVSTSPLLRRLAPYIWTHPYTHLSPGTCFVLDDGGGRAVGYCIGCADAEALAAGYDALDWVVDGRFCEDALAQTAYSGHWLLVDGNERLLAEGYRATMHIDLLDEWQGKGWGRRLIEAFVESVRPVGMADGAAACKGIWIGVGVSNAKVVPFYEKQGFRVKQREAEGQALIMVKDY